MRYDVNQRKHSNMAARRYCVYYAGATPASCGQPYAKLRELLEMNWYIYHKYFDRGLSGVNTMAVDDEHNEYSALDDVVMRPFCYGLTTKLVCQKY